MKKLCLSIALMAMAMFSLNAFADTKIAVVDMQQVIQSMPQFSQISAELKKQFGEREKKVSEARAAFKKAAEDFNRNSSVMTANDRKNAEQKLVAQQRDLQQIQLAFQKELTEAQNKKGDELISQAKKAIAQVATQQKYNLVMMQAGVLYSDNQVTDITSQVKQAMGGSMSGAKK